MAPPEREGPVHVANLGLRFLLELAALGGLVYWDWAGNEGVARVALAAALPLVAAAAWATFRTPGDDVSGEGLVFVPGPVRLGLEFALFGTATALLWVAGRPVVAGGLAVAVHYALDYRRIVWLLGQR